MERKQIRGFAGHGVHDNHPAGFFANRPRAIAIEFGWRCLDLKGAPGLVFCAG